MSSSIPQPLPLSERDPNINSGRTSRASRSSAGSKRIVRNKPYHQQHNQYQSPHGFLGHQNFGAHSGNSNKTSDLLSSAPGVMGMLRTTMEIGDVASLAVSGHNRGLNTHLQHPQHNYQQQIPLRPPNRRAGTTTRMSTESGGSRNQSQQSRPNSRHYVWPSVSSAGRRRSFTSNGTGPGYIHDQSATSGSQPLNAGPTSMTGFPSNGPGPVINRSDSPGLPPFAPSDGLAIPGNRRSMSLTNNYAPPPRVFGFSNHNSLTSLRSAPPGSREVAVYAPAGQSSAFRYPARLKRMGYRPSSPALSDTVGMPPPPLPPNGRFTAHGHLTTLSGSSRKSAGPPPIAVRNPFPYPAHRNRSAPTVIEPSNTIRQQPSFGIIRRRPTPVPPVDALPLPPTSPDYPPVPSGRIYQTTYLPVHEIPDRPPQLRSHPALGLQPASDSDPPTSSPPPTPTGYMHQGYAMEPRAMLDNKPAIPQYYDYTEDYDLEKEVSFVYAETVGQESPVPLPVGLVERVRALLAEAESNAANGVFTSPVSSIRNSLVGENSLFCDTSGTNIGSPVVKRITREMIIAALAPSSSLLVDNTGATTDGSPNDSDIAHTPDILNRFHDMDTAPAAETDVDDFQSCGSTPNLEMEKQCENEDEVVELAKTYGPKKIASGGMLYHDSSMSSFKKGKNTSNDEGDAIPGSSPPSPAKTVSSVYTVSPLPSGFQAIHPPPAPSLTGGDQVLEKVKKHWSLRRAAMAPPSTRSLASAPDVGLRSSSSLIINKAARTITAPELDGVSSGTTEPDYDIGDLRRFQLSTPSISSLSMPSTMDSNKKFSQKQEQPKQELPYMLLYSDSSSGAARSLATSVVTPSSSATEASMPPSLQKTKGQPLSALQPLALFSPAKSQEPRRSFEQPLSKLAATVANLVSNTPGHPPVHKLMPLRANPVLPDVQEEPSLESFMDLRQAQIGLATQAASPTRSSSAAPQPKQRAVGSSSNAMSTRASIGKVLLETLRLQQLGGSKEKRKSLVGRDKGSKNEHSRTPSFTSTRNSTSNRYGTTTTITASKAITFADPEIVVEPVAEPSNAVPSSPDIVSPVPRPSNFIGTGLLEAHAIPSLNFSSINLLAKLNDVLELGRAGLGNEFDSLLVDRAGEEPTDDKIFEVSDEEHPGDENEKIKIREKYRSLFLVLDEEIALPPAADDQFARETLLHDDDGYKSEHDADQDRPTSFDSMRIPTFRPLSPIELLEEVRRISVPSVNGLTQRLSELLPTLKRHLSGRAEESVNHLAETITEIRHVGEEVTKEDVDLGLTANIELFEARKSAETVRQFMSIEDALGPNEDHIDDIEAELEASCRNSIASGSTARPFSVYQPPEHVSNILNIARLPSGRLRSLSDSDVDWAISERAGRQALASRRSLINMAMMSGAIPSGSPETSRPWNLKSSYPWSNSIPYMDIHFPAVPSPMRPRGLSLASPLHRTVSPALSEDDSISALVVPPIAIAPNSVGTQLPTIVDDSVSPHLNPSRRSSTGARILNTLSIARHGRVPPFSTSQPRHSRRNSSRTHNRASTIRASSNTTVSDSVPNRQGYAPSHAGSNSAVLDAAKAVDPGDRYPTSGLGAPSQAVLAWDDQSFFSEDSGEDNETGARGGQKRREEGRDGKQRRGSLRVRLGKNRWKNQKKGKDVKTRSTASRISSDHQRRATADGSDAGYNDEEPTAMSHHEVKAKKLVTRLKSLL